MAERPLRLGGSLELPDGSRLVWSVAEGARGRRWRWVLTAAPSREVGTGRAGADVVVLLETSSAGRPTRLEVSSAAGLLTLHPEPDEREAHGNVVSAAGVRPLAFAWTPAHAFALEAIPAVLAACVAARADRGPTPVLLVDERLRVVDATALPGSTGPDGLPEAGARWPLE